MKGPGFEARRKARKNQQLLDWLLERAVACSGVDEAVYHRPMDGNLVTVTAFILAGGKSTRMGGQPKALMELGGRRIIDRVADVALKSGIWP